MFDPVFVLVSRAKSVWTLGALNIFLEMQCSSVLLVDNSYQCIRGGMREKLIDRLRFITVGNTRPIQIGNFQILPTADSFSGNCLSATKGSRRFDRFTGFTGNTAKLPIAISGSVAIIIDLSDCEKIVGHGGNSRVFCARFIFKVRCSFLFMIFFVEH